MSSAEPSPESASAPSTIFLLRHGARQDQLDRDWIRNSPTPWDPPLTTKGVMQARQTGAAMQTQLKRLPSSRERRVILHTSPFLRCVQTALALAEEIGQTVTLRVDAWLGEWLTPDYYTDIDPPPPARQLCASAVAGLVSGKKVGTTVDWPWDSLKLGDGGEYGE